MVDGRLDVVLGSIVSLGDSLFTSATELGISVDGGPEISPRTPLTSVPYAKTLAGVVRVQESGALYDADNIIGGHGIVGAGVRAATISGGGSIDNSSDRNFVFGNYGTVGGGKGNSVGGTVNPPSGPFDNQYATVGGGIFNAAIGSSSTVAGGWTNWAFGLYAAVAGGRQNQADGDYSMIPGGAFNEANGSHSFAAGRQAIADHKSTVVWADSLVSTPFTSTADNQFLIRARGGVGIGTNAPEEQLHITDLAGSTGIRLGGGSTPGPHGIIFDDDTGDQGVQLLWRTSANQLVLERTSEGTGTDGDDAFMYDRSAQRFVFTGSRNATANFDGHVVGIDNLSGSSADGLAIRLGASNAGGANNFISFFDGDGDAYGRIEGNGTDGVVYETTGGDYAEYLERIDPDETIRPGDVVAVRSGRISLWLESPSHYLVVSDRPAVLGNMPDPDRADRFERVAFVGQVPVKVRGTVEVGDYLVPSGRGDGSAVAVSAEDIVLDDIDSVIGKAWQSSSSVELKRILTGVGLDHSEVTKAILSNLQTRIKRLEELVAVLVADAGTEAPRQGGAGTHPPRPAIEEAETP